jgi:hypothetical protein
MKYKWSNTVSATDLFPIVTVSSFPSLGSTASSALVFGIVDSSSIIIKFASFAVGS